MNKYNEALVELLENMDYKDYSTQTLNKCCEAINKLQELIDKETPKKFKKIMDYSVGCPNCGHHLDKILGRNYDYCPRCGQKLDWS